MSYSYTDSQETPRITPAVQWLIALNVVVFFLELTLPGAADVQRALAFHTRDLTTQPWTIVTYMFVHGGFMHIALNLYMLWLFGRRVEQAWGTGPFTRFYVWCGLGGLLFHVMLVSGDGALLGASAAIFGVMLAYAMQWPDEELILFPFIFVSLRVKWVVFAMAGLNLISGIATLGSGSGVAYFAHLGGFAFAWLYLWWRAAPRVERLRQRISQIPDIPDEPPRAIPRTQPRPRERMSEIDEIVARSNAMATRQHPAQSASLSSRVGKEKADELNLVLDKISERGLDSLTRDERRLLDEMSRKLRGS